MSNAELDKEIRILEKKIQALQDKKVIPKCKKKFTCKNDKCGKTSILGNCDYLSLYFYHDCPYTPSYRYAESGVICPHCRYQHRCLEEASKDKFIPKYWGDPSTIYNRRFKEYADYMQKDFCEIVKKNGTDHEVSIKIPPYVKFINI